MNNKEKLIQGKYACNREGIIGVGMRFSDPSHIMGHLWGTIKI